MAKSLRLTVLSLAVLLLVGCDHATKLVAERTLGGPAAGAVSVVPGWIELRYAPNPDIAFSLLRGLDLPYKRWLLVAFASVGVVLMIVTLVRRRWLASGLEVTGWVLVLAGALGNVLDRAIRGHVVDFVRLPHWPIFNVADVLIVGGMATLLVASLRRRRVAADPPGDLRGS